MSSGIKTSFPRRSPMSKIGTYLGRCQRRSGSLSHRALEMLILSAGSDHYASLAGLIDGAELPIRAVSHHGEVWLHVPANALPCSPIAFIRRPVDAGGDGRAVRDQAREH